MDILPLSRRVDYNARINRPFRPENKCGKEAMKMKQDEKKAVPWEVADPKPPVVQSGRINDRKRENNVM